MLQSYLFGTMNWISSKSDYWYKVDNVKFVIVLLEDFDSEVKPLRISFGIYVILEYQIVLIVSNLTQLISTFRAANKFDPS